MNIFNFIKSLFYKFDIKYYECARENERRMQSLKMFFIGKDYHNIKRTNSIIKYNGFKTWKYYIK